jgi:hypothetical protein
MGNRVVFIVSLLASDRQAWHAISVDGDVFLGGNGCSTDTFTLVGRVGAASVARVIQWGERRS